METENSSFNEIKGACCLLQQPEPGTLIRDGKHCPSYLVPKGCSATVHTSQEDSLECTLWHKNQAYTVKWCKDGSLEYWQPGGSRRGLLNIPRCCALHTVVNDLEKPGCVTCPPVELPAASVPEAQQQAWIPIGEMQDRCVYLCDARNFKLGIWLGGSMHGMRHKWGDYFLDSEHHWDSDGGTCKPLMRITEPLKRLDTLDWRNFRGHIVMEDILESLEQLLQGMARLDDLSPLREVFP